MFLLIGHFEYFQIKPSYLLYEMGIKKFVLHNRQEKWLIRKCKEVYIWKKLWFDNVIVNNAYWIYMTMQPIKIYLEMWNYFTNRKKFPIWKY